jgi:integrase
MFEPAFDHGVGTWISYRHAVQRYLIPGLGRRQLAWLTTKEVRVWLAEVAATCQCCRQHTTPDARSGSGAAARSAPTAAGESSPTTLRHLRALLSSAVAHAVREDDLPRNVVSAVRLPVPGRSAFTPLTADEARRILDSARQQPLLALFELRVTTGRGRG